MEGLKQMSTVREGFDNLFLPPSASSFDYFANGWAQAILSSAPTLGAPTLPTPPLKFDNAKPPYTGIAAPTGNDVNYYLVDVKSPKRLAPYIAEAEDIIEALGMTFAEGCAFKAIWRSCAARTLGVIKPGMDAHGVYDAEKIAYYGKRILAMRKNKV